jgi:hypothetical protein
MSSQTWYSDFREIPIIEELEMTFGTLPDKIARTNPLREIRLRSVLTVSQHAMFKV